MPSKRSNHCVFFSKTMCLLTREAQWEKYWNIYIYTYNQETYSVFMLRMALRDIIASVTAFLNCLKEEGMNAILKHAIPWVSSVLLECGNDITKLHHTKNTETHLIARYMGRMANRGKVWTFIIMVIKAMYSSTLIKPGRRKKKHHYCEPQAHTHTNAHTQSRGNQAQQIEYLWRAQCRACRPPCCPRDSHFAGQ